MSRKQKFSHNTSRTCPCCGHVSADNRQTQAQFRCVECGFAEHADVVGAINILRQQAKWVSESLLLICRLPGLVPRAFAAPMIASFLDNRCRLY
jgi:hypothetical protein